LSDSIEHTVERHTRIWTLNARNSTIVYKNETFCGMKVAQEEEKWELDFIYVL